MRSQPPDRRLTAARDTLTWPSRDRSACEIFRRADSLLPRFRQVASDPPGICCRVGALLAVGRRPRARPEDQAAIEKVTKLNKKAVDEYENLNFEESRKLLKEALESAPRRAWSNHPVTARTYIHLGIVMFAGFKQRDEAIKQFRKALEIQPDIKLDKSLANPEVQEVFDEAVEAARRGRRARPRSAATPAADADRSHAGDRATAGQADRDQGDVDSGPGREEGDPVVQRRRRRRFRRARDEGGPGSGNWVGEIPASATQGATSLLHRGQGDKEKTLATKGSARKPLRITIWGRAGARAGKTKKPGRRGRGRGADLVPRARPRQRRRLGDGQRRGELQDVVQPAGFAPAKLVHIAPEIGYFLSPELLLSLQLRYQHGHGRNEYYRRADHGRLRATDLLSPATTRSPGLPGPRTSSAKGTSAPTSRGTAGLGTIRHVATFEIADATAARTARPTCIDTVPSGPVFVGAGAGIMYNLTPGFALTSGRTRCSASPSSLSTST